MPGEILVRLADAADAPAIWRLNRSCFGYEFPREQAVRQVEHIGLSETDQLYVAQLNGRVVGYAHGSGYLCTYRSPMKTLVAICVEEAARGKGVGKALLRAVEDWAREDGCRGVRLMSGFERGAAHEFYEHNGYVHRKNQRNYEKDFF